MKKTTIISNRPTHDGNIDDDVKELKRLQKLAGSNSIVRKKAMELRRATKLQTIQACFDYVVKTVPYKSDPQGIELITAPWLLISGEVVGEDCESMVLLLLSLLGLNGINGRYVVLAWKTEQFTHIIAEAYANGQWIELDPTMSERGFGKSIPHSKRKRQKNYKGVKMPQLEIQTLSDKYSDMDKKPRKRCNSCGGKKNGKGQRRGINVNNVINIGSDLSNHSSSSNSLNNGNNHSLSNGTDGITQKPKVRVSAQSIKECEKQHGSSASAHAQKLAEEHGLPVKVIERPQKDGTIKRYTFMSDNI